MERKLKSKSKRAKELKLPMFQGGIEPKRLKELDKSDAERPSKTNRKVKAWLVLRKRKHSKIDPRTAEVTWAWRGFDPYGVETDVPPELDCRSREWFLRRPEATYGCGLATCLSQLIRLFAKGVHEASVKPRLGGSPMPV